MTHHRAEDAETSHDVHQMSLFIRKVLIGIFGSTMGHAVPILYGGSVERANAHDLITEADVSGFLVGHASLDGEHFNDIVRNVENAFCTKRSAYDARFSAKASSLAISPS